MDDSWINRHGNRTYFSALRFRSFKIVEKVLFAHAGVLFLVPSIRISILISLYWSDINNLSIWNINDIFDYKAKDSNVWCLFPCYLKLDIANFQSSDWFRKCFSFYVSVGNFKTTQLIYDHFAEISSQIVNVDVFHLLKMYFSFVTVRETQAL